MLLWTRRCRSNDIREEREHYHAAVSRAKATTTTARAVATIALVVIVAVVGSSYEYRRLLSRYADPSSMPSGAFKNTPNVIEVSYRYVKNKKRRRVKLQ